MPDFAFILAGFAVGLIVGLTGVGGGSLMTPVLIFVFGVKPNLAVGTDLLFAAFTKLGGTLGLARQRLGRIDLQTPPSLPIAACQARREEGAGGTSNRRATTLGRPLWATLRAKALGSPRRRYSPLVYPDTRRGSRLAVDCPGPWRRGCLNVDSPYASQ